MARDVEANVNINDKSEKGLRGFLARLKGADDAAKKLQSDLDKTSTSTSRFDKATQANGKSLAKLHSEIGIAKTELGTLARAFADAGTSAERIDISKAIRKTEQEIRGLTKNADVLKALVPSPDSFGPVSFGLKKALVLGATAAAPLVGSLASAAIIGGAAGLGVVGGVALVASDPRVKAAGSDLAENLLGGLREDASVFVQPVLGAIGQIEHRFEELRPRLKNIFSNSSQYLGPLTDAALDGIAEIVRGFDALTAKAGPVVNAFGNSFRIIGEATGDALETIAGGADDAGQSLEATAQGTGIAIKGFGYLVRGLNEASGAVNGFIGGKVVDWGVALGLMDKPVTKANATLLQMTSVAPAAGAAIAAITSLLPPGVVRIDEYQHAIQTTGSALLTLDERLQQVYGTQHSLFDAQTNSAQAYRTLNQSIADNGRSLKTNSQEGINNRNALSGVVTALNGAYKAYVDVNGEGEAANGIAKSNYDNFVNKVSAGFHISKAAAREYARQLGLIPPKTDTKANLNTHDAEARAKALKGSIGGIKGKTVTLSALDAATAKARAIQASINALHGKTIHVRVVATGPAKGQALYGNQAPQGAADSSFAMGGDGASVARTGGPVTVNSPVTVNAFWDVDGFYAEVDRRIDARIERTTYRQKVGRR